MEYNKIKLNYSTFECRDKKRRIGNPMKIRNGTATVIAEVSLHGESWSLGVSPEKAAGKLKMRKSGDLLGCISSAPSDFRDSRIFCLQKTDCDSSPESVAVVFYFL